MAPDDRYREGDCRYASQWWRHRTCWQVFPVPDVYPTAEERWCHPCREHMRSLSVERQARERLGALVVLFFGRQRTRDEALKGIEFIAQTFSLTLPSSAIDDARRKVLPYG